MISGQRSVVSSRLSVVSVVQVLCLCHAQNDREDSRAETELRPYVFSLNNAEDSCLTSGGSHWSTQKDGQG